MSMLADQHPGRLRVVDAEPGVLSSRVLGCQIEAHYPIDHEAGFRLARLVLAAIESLLSTGLDRDMVSFSSLLSIFVNPQVDPAERLSFSLKHRVGVPEFIISVDSNSQMGFGEQQQLRRGLVDFLVAFVVEVVGSSASAQSFKALIDHDGALDRSTYFSAPLFPPDDVFAPSIDSFDLRRFPKQPKATLFRRAPATSRAINEVHHESLHNDGLIRNEVWDRAGWNGCVYLTTDETSADDVMGLVFKDEQAGSQVFESLVDQVGRDNTQGRLSVAFLEASDSPRYTASIQSNPSTLVGRAQVFLSYGRLEMAPSTSDNLRRFMNSIVVGGPAEDGRGVPNRV